MTIAKVTESKKAEIIAGVDGFMVYDLKLVPYMNKVSWRHCLSKFWPCFTAVGWHVRPLRKSNQQQTAQRNHNSIRSFKNTVRGRNAIRFKTQHQSGHFVSVQLAERRRTFRFGELRGRLGNSGDFKVADLAVDTSQGLNLNFAPAVFRYSGHFVCRLLLRIPVRLWRKNWSSRSRKSWLCRCKDKQTKDCCL